jgi:hypothetical protein
MRIRRGLGSRRLSCGCVAGIYETYRDETVTILDAKGPACLDGDHVAGNLLPVAMSQNQDAPIEPFSSSDR